VPRAAASPEPGLDSGARRADPAWHDRRAAAPRGEWFGDARDGSRALRVSWHHELGCVVLSTWRDEACVATTRLTPAEAARLIGVLAQGLASATGHVAVADAPVADQA
jgi:hypothetical protein